MIKMYLNNLDIKNEIKLPILAQADYLKCKSNIFGWFVSDAYIIPFYIQKKLVFKRLIFTHAPIKIRESKTIVASNDFLNDMVGYLKKNKICDFISKAQSNVVFKEYPDSCEWINWGTYIIDLNKTDDELLNSFHSKHRNVIKKSIKDDVKIVQTVDIDIIYDNIKQTLKRQKSFHYPSINYLRALINQVPNNTAFFLALKDDIIQGCAIIIYDDNCGYYMYGGSIINPYTGSLNYLQYEVALFLKSKNIKFYDLVGARLKVEKGSKYEGIQRFKIRFGPSLDQGYAFRVIFNPLKFQIFNLLIKIYGFIKGFKYSDPIDQLK